jgi:HSP20 family protein
MRQAAGLEDEVNRLFNSVLTGGSLRGDAADYVPAVDIEETAEAYVLRADLPGVAPKDVKVSVLGETLTIRGERKQERAEKNGGYHRAERVYGSFERAFTLGTPVRADLIRASYKDGVLEVSVPKAEEAKLREIEVKVG